MDSFHAEASHRAADSSSAFDRVLEKLSLDFLLKIIQIIGYGLGPAIFTLNVFNFVPGKRGYFYTSGTEWGIALGVLLVSIAYVAQWWRR